MKGFSIARDLLSPSLFTQLIVIHSLDLSAQLIVCSIAIRSLDRYYKLKLRKFYMYNS